jgi:hypothetical protein
MGYPGPLATTVMEQNVIKQNMKKIQFQAEHITHIAPMNPMMLDCYIHNWNFTKAFTPVSYQI